MKTKNLKKNGFTLLETLLALGIMGTSLFLLVNAWTGSFGRLEKTQLSFEVASLLERKMGELERKYRGRPLAEIPEDEETGDFGEEYPKYSWKVQAKNLELPNLAPLLTAESNEPPPQEVLSALQTFSETLSKSVKEVKLTIYYKHPKRTQDYSISTYFVDYENELNLGF